MRSLVRPYCLLLLWVLAPLHAAQFGTDRFVEYRPGELPLVLTSPHGGNLTPDSIPDRKEGVTTKDMFTQELTLAISDALHAATGRRPHVILSHLHRRKLDPNREIKEAAAGQPAAERAWREFHDFIRAANAVVVARHGFAFLVDIHGHAHPIPRLELGYALNNAQLNQDDRAFDAAGVVAVSTLRDLHARLGGSAADLIRGPRRARPAGTTAGKPSVLLRRIHRPGPRPRPRHSPGGRRPVRAPARRRARHRREPRALLRHRGRGAARLPPRALRLRPRAGGTRAVSG